MAKRYLNEDTADFLTFIFVILELIWLVAIIRLNLPKLIGSLLVAQVARFPLNIGTFFVLLYVGGVMILIIIRWFFRIFIREIDNEKEVKNDRVRY